MEKNLSTDMVIHYPRPASYFAATCAILFVVIGVVGNLLTIIALARSNKLRSHATTAFVISLAVSDLLFCFFNLPLTASRYIHESWILGDTLCNLFPFFFYGNVAASLFSMVLITINRYVLIASPSLYDKIYKKSYIIAMIFGIWSFCFTMLVPTLFGAWGEFGLDPQTFSCTIIRNTSGSPKKFLFFFGCLMPCVTIIICYTGIFIKVRQSRKNVLSHSPAASTSNRTGLKSPASKESEKAQRREDLRLSRMMLIIFCSFLVCFIPLMIVNVADDNVKVPVLHVIASVMAWASSVINPLIYAVSNRQYRAAYRSLFCKKSTRRPGVSATQSKSSRTLVTDMLHFTANADKFRVLQTNGNSEDVSQRL